MKSALQPNKNEKPDPVKTDSFISYPKAFNSLRFLRGREENGKRKIIYTSKKEKFNLNLDEVVFVYDINRVAEVCKSLGAGFIGVPASMPHNYQREEMIATGVKYMVNKFTDITKELIHKVDDHLLATDLWK